MLLEWIDRLNAIYERVRIGEIDRETAADSLRKLARDAAEQNVPIVIDDTQLDKMLGRAAYIADEVEDEESSSSSEEEDYSDLFEGELSDDIEEDTVSSDDLDAGC